MGRQHMTIGNRSIRGERMRSYAPLSGKKKSDEPADQFHPDFVRAVREACQRGESIEEFTNRYTGEIYRSGESQGDASETE